MGVHVPCRVHAKVAQGAVVWTDPAALALCIPPSFAQREECRIEEGHLMPTKFWASGYFVSSVGTTKRREMADNQLD